ncbi:MAG: hypothetical protein BWY66_00437 [bacterium ADurb.Bin374]|nr:MAG: hypothetical protein BWY66_00437 [bacterium ADurb.Bin374]
MTAHGRIIGFAGDGGGFGHGRLGHRLGNWFRGRGRFGDRLRNRFRGGFRSWLGFGSRFLDGLGLFDNAEVADFDATGRELRIGLANVSEHADRGTALLADLLGLAAGQFENLAIAGLEHDLAAFDRLDLAGDGGRMVLLGEPLVNLPP